MRFPFQRFVVSGHSMEPTLCAGDRVLVRCGAYRRKMPARGDVVAFRPPDHPDLVFVKRVIDVADHGGVVVAGDNPSDSLDSRAFGIVPADAIIGRVVFRYAFGPQADRRASTADGRTGVV